MITYSLTTNALIYTTLHNPEEIIQKATERLAKRKRQRNGKFYNNMQDLKSLEKTLDCPMFDVEETSPIKLDTIQERWSRYLEMMMDLLREK